MGTHWEPREHIENFMGEFNENLKGTCWEQRKRNQCTLSACWAFPIGFWGHVFFFFGGYIALKTWTIILYHRSTTLPLSYFWVWDERSREWRRRRRRRPMHENSFEGRWRVGEMIVPFWKKMQITIRIWATPFSSIRLRELSLYNHLKFFFNTFIWVVEPLARGWRNGISLIYFVGYLPTRTWCRMWQFFGYFYLVIKTYPSKILLFFNNEKLRKYWNFFFQF